MSYCNGAAAVRDLARLVRPPKRMPVSEAVGRFVKVRTPSGGVAAWDRTLTPYMCEPMDMLASRYHEAVVFVGPARTGKTNGLVDGWIGYNVMCDPGDMLIVQMSQEKARDYSKLRVNRLLRNSLEIGAELASSKQDDNTYDKWFRSGVAVKIGWPTINQLASNDFKYVALTDYDRMPQDIDREGSPFSLGQKRTQTYLSRGMTLAESSPGFEVNDPNWKPRPEAPHEAPPTRGILSLYNLGDRRQLYWRCPHCAEYYRQPIGIEGFAFARNRDLFGITDTMLAGDVHVVCTSCGGLIDEGHKGAMTASAIWVPEGCHIEREGDEYGLAGQPRQSTIASFWMGGAAAAYQSWTSIAQRYLNAMRQFDLTGDEELLRATTNVDQGAAYLPRQLAASANQSDYGQRTESLERFAVPEGVRGLLAAVDVQGGQNARFVVQVIGLGRHGEKWIVDRYALTDSERTDGDGNKLPIQPHAHVEDWELLTKRVVNATYQLPDGRELRIYRTAVDSGGEDGVTEQAYTWWRGLRKTRLHRRVWLIKGGSTDAGQKVKQTFPDSSGRSDRKSGSRGDVPVLMVNPNKIKDAVNNDLARETVGPGYIHLPDWLGQWFFDELSAERRDDKGRWRKVSKRNEAFDLLVYVYALLFHLRLERVNWGAPPAWLRPWDENSEVMTAEQRREMKAPSDSRAANTENGGRQARFKFKT